ncbi:MAG TPA: hypothetical protein VJ810_28240 [Blastocatellia bacterium]|nr:hypothetical protein [Blastocatellia bacterium]
MFKRFLTSALTFATGFALCAVIGGSSFAFLSTSLPSVKSQEPSASQIPCKPQLWEYRVVSRDSSHKNLDAELNLWAKQGFEVFSVKQTGEGATHGFDLTILLRRPRQ